ncbi:hypothetical protein QTP86_031444, partial [Hemibagrus guttatus]
MLEHLHVLRLSNNSLTGLGRAAFNSTPSLMEVYLDGNNISSLDNATFSDLPHLEVSYLQQFLDDQAHNIYILIGVSVIENDPNSVVCSAPLTLQGQAIIDLQEEEYCGAEDGEADERIEGSRNEDEEKKRGTDAVTKIDLLPAVTLHTEQETESNDREEVFRKTLYRVISQEEEIEDWKEVEEICWGMTERDKGRREGGAERRKTRYSLILREERESVMEGRKGDTEWLV